MKTIGVFLNEDKDVDKRYFKILSESVIKNGAKINLINHSQNTNIDNKIEEIVSSSDIIICMGGDGTFLKTARMIYKFDKPILGINLGNLGFLTEIDKNSIEDSIKKVLQGEYEIEQRMMLEVLVKRNKEIIAKEIALNDAVVSRGALSRILHLKFYLNESFIDSFPGDGLIISTPTGSTGYSLSAGGPIVEPDIDLIIATPVCPHILYCRSYVTTGDRIVKIVVDEEYHHDAMATIDGQKGIVIRGGDEIIAKKSQESIKMLRIRPRKFFNVLRNKMYQREEVLRKDEI